MQQVLHIRPVYQLGKIKSKYIIIDILGYSIDEITEICKLLHSCSRQMRQMLKKNYKVLRNMLDETHSFDTILLLTHNYKKSRTAHERLEKIMKRECKRVMKIDYGL